MKLRSRSLRDRPNPERKSPVSSAEKDRSWSRSSTSSSLARIRWSRRPGSARLARTNYRKGRPALQQQGHRVRPARSGQVEIVDHQHLRPVQPVQVVGQGGHHVRGHLAVEAQELAGVLSQSRLLAGSSQGFDHGSHKPAPGGVGAITAQPRGWSLRVGGQPVGQRAVLPAPGEPITR